MFGTVTDNLTLFDVVPIYQGNDVLIELQRIANLRDAGATPNQLAVGTALDGISLTSSGDLFTMINTLGALSPAEQRRALDQLSGDLFGTTQTLGLQVGQQFQQLVNARLINNGQFLAGGDTTAIASHSHGSGADGLVRGQSPTASLSGWTQGFGASGNFQSDGNAAGASFGQGGLAYGLDLGGDDSGVIGIAGGNSFLSFQQGSGSGQLNSQQVGLYLLKRIEDYYLLGNANYGYNDYDSTRVVNVGPVSQVLQGDFVGHQFGAYAEGGYQLEARAVRLQPFFGLQYLNLAQQGFSETGGPAALAVAGSQADALRTHLGSRLVFDSMAGRCGAVWTPYLHGRWVAELLDDSRLVTATFNGAPVGGTFATQGNTLGQNYGLFGAGLNVQLTCQWSLFGNYDLQAGNRFTAHTGSGGVMYLW